MLVINEKNLDSVSKTAEILAAGGVVAFATETVYALACDASNDAAVKKLYQVKNREESKPIAVLLKNLEAAKNNFFIDQINESVINEFMPGPLTLIVEAKNNSLSKLLNNGKKEIGIRIPDHKFSLSLLKEFGGIIAATSANISYNEPAINAQDVKNYFSEKIDLLVDGGICQHKIASTVARIKNNNIEIFRVGLIKKEQLLNCLLSSISTLKNSTLE
jgi:L-threonylcarbamoyladenylate synthase